MMNCNWRCGGKRAVGTDVWTQYGFGHAVVVSTGVPTCAISSAVMFREGGY